MQHHFWASLGRSALYTAAAVTLASCANMPGESASSALQRANTAMGGTVLKSISFAGTGTGATFGQAYLAGTEFCIISVPILVQATVNTPVPLLKQAFEARTAAPIFP